MSLHTLANHLQTAGRGEDKVLVHMTPGEVNGLQSLAMAHGGSLTINPHTGLPEAGFLSAILPMVAGAALAATGVGAPMAAMMVGGAGAAMTGSLSKGLMMGLGAYGGAGLGAGLMGGAEAATAGALGSANTIAAQNAANMGAQATSTLGNTMGAGMAGGAGAATGAAASQVPIGLQAATGTGAYAPGAQLPGQPPPQPTVFGGTAQPAAPVVASSSVNPTTGMPAGAQSVESATAFDKLKSMPGKAYDLLSGSGPEAEKARDEFLKQNKNYLLAGGLGTLAMSREEPKAPSRPHYKVNQYDWNREFNPSSREPGSSAERSYFADGGSTSLPVEQMSQQNSLMDNPSYPMAYQNTPQYSTHRQNPIPQNVVYPATDDNTNPYNGQERSMAAGGSTTNSAASYGLKKTSINGLSQTSIPGTGSSWADLVKVANQLGIDPSKFIRTTTETNWGVTNKVYTKDLIALYNAIDTAAKAAPATITAGGANTATSNAATITAGTTNTATSNAATTGIATLTPQQTAAKNALIAEQNWAKTGIKSIDLSGVKAPDKGFTAENTVSTYAPTLKQQKEQLESVESRLKTYIDPKTKAVKPGYEEAYNYLQGLVKDQQKNLNDGLNVVYQKIPKTDVDLSDPKKATAQKTNQTNEYNAVNKLLTDYVNNTSLKATDYAAAFMNKVSAENAQQAESTLYADKIAPALAKLAEYTGKDSTGKDITGGLSGLTSGWNAEASRQSKDVVALKQALTDAGLMDSKGNFTIAANQYSGLTNLAKSALQKQQDEVTQATDAQGKALQDFSTATARGESIGTRGISAIPKATSNATTTTTSTTTGGLGSTSNNPQTVTVPTSSGSVKYVIQPNGTWAPEQKLPEYQKLEYGKVNALTGWDSKTTKPYEPEDVQQVFQEVVGRKATKDELDAYVGTKGTIQDLANKVNKSPDISIARGTKDPFTEKELQAQAKYYWGREMTAGELANYKKANYANFGKLRDALTSTNTYVDYLNKLNKEQFTKENTPAPIGANPNDISSTYSDILQRKPTAAELQNYLSKKISINDLKTELKASNEYIGRLVSDPKNLTSAIAALASTQIQNLSSQVINGLNSSQVNAISTTNIAALTTNQVQNLSSQVINQLNSNQLQAITTTNISTLNTNQVQNLTSQVINQLTSNQIAVIATTGIGTLATDQIQAISTTGIGGLDTTQVQTIATTGLSTLATNQVQAINTTGIGALTTTQIQNLTSQQVTNLFTSQTSPLTPLPPSVVTTVGRNDILPPPVTMTRQQMEDYGRQYSSFTPSSPGLYTPQVTPNPQASIEGAMPYQDVNKQLGLTGLYEQMARATPSIQSGMNFTPNQAVAQASPFANTNPGMVSLQSIAPPSAQSYGSLLTPEEQALLGYAQAQPIIPGTHTNIASLTPAQQVYLSSAQSQPRNMAEGGYANGGYHLGDYSDGGRLLKGPGDGVSDSIPASIGNKQPARLADGEFVIPARIVSEIGNGSTDAGARKLYAMMNRIQQARNKTVGQGKVAVKSGADRMLPA